MPGTDVSPHSVPSDAIHVVCPRYSASGDAPSSSIHDGDCPIQRGANSSLRGGAPDRAGVRRRRDQEDRVALRLRELLHLAGDVLVADLEPLRVGHLEAELLGREVDARLARLSVGVVLDHRADVLALAVALVDVVVERVDRLDLVRPADRQQVLLPHPDRVQRRRRGDHLVTLELRQHGQR